MDASREWDADGWGKILGGKEKQEIINVQDHVLIIPIVKKLLRVCKVL